MQTATITAEKSDADTAKETRSTHPDRLVDERELRTVYNIPYSRSRLYQLEKIGVFPRRRKLGPGPSGKARWRAADIETYLRNLTADAPAAPARETAAA